jgi:hypothetical protein
LRTDDTATGRARGAGVLLDAVVVVTLASSVVAGVLARPDGLLAAVGTAIAGLPFLAVGVVILRRYPRHLIGWMLAAAGFLVATGEITTSIGPDRPHRVVVLAAWYGEWYWIAMILLLFVLIPLLFPTGRLPSPRWRPLVWVVLAAGAQAVVAAMLQGELQVRALEHEGIVTVENPVGVAPWAEMEVAPPGYLFFGMLLPAVGLAVVSLVVRYRRADVRERAQLKWGALGAGGVATVFLLQGVIDTIVGVRLPELVERAAMWALPVSFGVAILRRHLYGIDRIISRSVAYLLVSLALLGVYAASVVALQPVLRPLTGTSDLAVAVSTLLVAASFGPLRRRIQTVVDRRFNRRRFDQIETVSRFSAGLRDQVELDTVSEQLRSVTVATLEPTTVTVWLRGASGP